MFKSSLKRYEIWLSVIFFTFLSIWWVILNLSGVKETFQNYLFGAVYGLICIWGGYWGLVASQEWGGWRSMMGKALMVLSLGLLTQEFGQLVFSYYNIFLQVPVPYPSLADIGFFGTIPFFIWGIYLLGRVSGAKFSLKRIGYKIVALAVPAILLVSSYAIFLKGYEFDFLDPLKLFLDFGYPFGESLYISLAILTFFLTRNFLGGVMRSRVLLMLFAFVFWFLADFNFLWQSQQGTWLNGGYGDYLYFLAYFLMTLALIQMKVTADELRAN